MVTAVAAMIAPIMPLRFYTQEGIHLKLEIGMKKAFTNGGTTRDGLDLVTPRRGQPRIGSMNLFINFRNTILSLVQTQMKCCQKWSRGILLFLTLETMKAANLFQMEYLITLG
jgi:hypothetical protein